MAAAAGLDAGTKMATWLPICLLAVSILDAAGGTGCSLRRGVPEESLALQAGMCKRAEGGRAHSVSDLAAVASAVAASTRGAAIASGADWRVQEDRRRELVQLERDGRAEVGDLRHRVVPALRVDRLSLRGGIDADVTAFEVKGRVDYDKLVSKWGSQRINATLIERMEQLTGKRAHHLIRRGFFFSHRDLDKLLDDYEQGEPFYLYTGRGPSSDSLHVGHLVPFLLTQWLQEAFRVPVVIQLTDDEKFLWNQAELDTYTQYAYANARDIMAVGFIPELTYVMLDTEQIAQLYPNALRIQKLVSLATAKSIFGFDDHSNIGQLAFPALQIAPALSSSLPGIFPAHSDMWCLIPCAIDQDPYFRLARDVTPRLHQRKPALLHSKFIPALQGDVTAGKMSASSQSSAIFLTDTLEEVKAKINKFAYSGGRSSVEEHRRLGGDTSVDVSFRYLEFFLEDDTALATIKSEYESGALLSGQLKAKAISCIQHVLARHTAARQRVTDELLARVLAVRPLIPATPALS